MLLSLTMAEEISNIVSKVTIDEEKEAILDLDTLNPNLENSKLSLVVIGKLLKERYYNIDAFKGTINRVWSPAHGLVIKVLSPNLYAF